MANIQNSAAEAKDLGNELYKKGDYEGAIAKYSECIEFEPNNSVYYSNRSAAFMALNKYREAAEDARKAIEFDTKMIKCHLRMAKAKLFLGHIAEAIRILTDALDVCHEHKLVTEKKLIEREKIQAQDLMHKLQESEKTLRNQEKNDVDSLAKSLDNIESLFLTLQPVLKSYGTTCKNSSKLTGVDISHFPAFWQFLRGLCLLHLQQYDEALQAANSVLRKDSTASNFLLLRAEALRLLDRHPVKNLIGILGNALSFDPDHKAARLLVKRIKALEKLKSAGNDAFKAKNYAEALENYTSWIELESSKLPDEEEGPHSVLYGGIPLVKIYSNRATVFSLLGRHKEAVSDCNKALRELHRVCMPLEDIDYELSAEQMRDSQQSALFLKLLLRRADSFTKLASASDSGVESEQYLESSVRDYQQCDAMQPHDSQVKRALQNAKSALKQAKKKDYYKILGIGRDASDAEIKKAYRRLALQHHPDKQAGLSDEEKASSEHMFKAVSDAYGVLSDPKKKRMFDMGMDIDGSSASDPGFGGSPFGHGPGGMSAQDLFSMLYAQQASRGGGGGHPFGQGGGHQYYFG